MLMLKRRPLKSLWKRRKIFGCFLIFSFRELHVFAPDHSVISEDSNSVILIPPSSGGLAPFPNSGLASSYRFVSVPCSKCSSVCCAARRNCSSCGAKLRSVQESETAFHTNRKMTKLPPLPAQAPSKSDRVAYQAFKVFGFWFLDFCFGFFLFGFVWFCLVFFWFFGFLVFWFFLVFLCRSEEEIKNRT